MQYLKETVSENDTDRFLPLVNLAKKNGLSVTTLIEKFKSMSHVKHLTLPQLEEEEKLINYKTSSLSRKQREEVLTLLSTYRGMLEAVKKINDEEEKIEEEENILATVDSGSLLASEMESAAIIDQNDVSHIQPTKEAING